MNINKSRSKYILDRASLRYSVRNFPFSFVRLIPNLTKEPREHTDAPLPAATTEYNQLTITDRKKESQAGRQAGRKAPDKRLLHYIYQPTNQPVSQSQCTTTPHPISPHPPSPSSSSSSTTPAAQPPKPADRGNPQERATAAQPSAPTGRCPTARNTYRRHT